MKILLLGTSFAPSYGGPAVSVSRLAQNLFHSGVAVVLWAPDGTALSSPLVSELPQIDRRAGPLQLVLSDFEGRLDVIHDNGIWLLHHHRAAVAARRLRIPRVVTVRGMLEPWSLSYKKFKKEVAWRTYQRGDLNSASLIHATARSEAENLAQLGLRPPIATIPNGVDIPEATSHLPRDAVDWEHRRKHRALFLGRIHPKKGIPMLLEAWRRIRPPDWELLIAGPTETAHDIELRAQVERLGLGSDIKFHDPVYGPEKSLLYYSADLFVLPTHSENFGLTVAEALAHGVPVLTTTAAPWRLLQEERCGWWVPPTIQGITDGLDAATRMPRAELREMGRRGRSIVKSSFSWRHIAERVRDEIYEHVLRR